jgi:hypothetical protein
MGAGGEISDFQHIQTLLDELVTDDYRTDDGHTLAPAEVCACDTRMDTHMHTHARSTHTT